MPAFPHSYVKLGWKDSGDDPQPVVERSEMERGVAKQRRTQADTVVTEQYTLYFDTAVKAEDFLTWFYSPTGANGGAGWFDFTRPSNGAVVQARIVGGIIGMRKPAISTWARSQRQVKFEYVRAAL